MDFRTEAERHALIQEFNHLNMQFEGLLSQAQSLYSSLLTLRNKMNVNGGFSENDKSEVEQLIEQITAAFQAANI